MSAYPAASTGPAHDWIRHHARRRPDHVAVVNASDGTETTYAAFDRIVDGWAHLLVQNGARPGEVVAVLAHNSPTYLALEFACARAGAVFLPLNWRLALPELDYITRDARPTLLIHDDEHGATASALAADHGMPALATSTPVPRAVTTFGSTQRLEDIAAIMYTSGTTGRPKGALITHGMTLWHTVNITPEARVSPDAVHLALLPFFHTGGLNLYVHPVLHAGGTVVVPRKFDVDQTFDLLSDAALGVTHVFGVPTIYQSLAQHARFADADLSRLQMAGVGGAACPVALLNTWADRGRPLAQGWGMTEAGPSGAVVDLDDPRTPYGSVGRPLLHVSTRIVDPYGVDVTPGEVGELWVQGPSITPGYWRNPIATADACTDGWFRTGDAARFDENGYLFIVDRWKDMYISGGENVYPAEVEAAIRDLDVVGDVAVVGTQDATWGEVGVAFVVPAPGRTVNAEAVVAHCASRLARFKVPRRVEVVPDLPMTGSGKIQKRQLVERAAAPDR